MKLKYKLPSLEETVEGLRVWKQLREIPHLSVQIYFDSAAVIDMMIGSASVYKGHVFQPYLYERSANVVYALAFRKWLGDIYMLPPHTEEFVETLRFNPRLFPETGLDHAKTESDALWGKLLQTDDLAGLNDLLRQQEKGVQVINELKEHPYHPFLGVYLTQKRNFWKYRYKHLVQDKEVLRFSPESDYNYGDVTRSDFFREVLGRLNKMRSHTANNYIDAIALCVLDSKIRAAEQDHSNQVHLPFFFSDQEHILETAQAMSRKAAPDGHYPFMYTDPRSGKSFSIVRGAAFFIIEGFYNSLTQNQPSDTSFDDFQRALEELQRDVGGESTNHHNAWASSVNQVQHRVERTELHEKVILEFFDRWWRENGYADITAALELREQEGAEKAEINAQVETYIQQERTRLNRQIKGYGRRVAVIRKTWEAFRGFDQFIDVHYVKSKAIIDAFEEFGPRFNFSSRVCERIQQAIDRIIEAVAGGPTGATELREAESEIISDLVDGLFKKSDTEEEQLEQLDKLAMGIGFFFLYQKYKLVSEVCEVVAELYAEQFPESEDKYPRPWIALIHAASLFLSGEQSSEGQNAEDQALEIIQCVEEKADENYKLWVGLSYLYNLLWEYRGNDYNFRELFRPDDFALFRKSKAFQYLQTAIRYCYRAFLYIEKLIAEDDDPAKLRDRWRKYYYALNNYIFFTTLYSGQEDFRELDYYQEKLENITSKPEYFQEGRFSDTLARYYFRLAILADSSGEFENEIQNALYFSERSLKPRRKQLYESLNRQLKQWRDRKGYESARKQQKLHQITEK